MLKKVGTISLISCFLIYILLGLLLLGSMVPFFGGYEILVVESGSMAPTIPLGSAIVLRPADSYLIGDVVTFQRMDDDEVTTHRIVGTEVFDGETFFTMQGDANNVADQRPVREKEISGKIWWHVPYLGFLLDFLRGPIGFALLVGLPALWIIREQLQVVRREIKKQGTDTSVS